MQAVTSAFLTAAASGAPAVINAWLQPRGGTGTNVVTLNVEDGAVIDSRLRQIRRSCTLVATVDGIPDLSPSSLTSPYGTELHVERGFRLADGTVETVKLGVFRLHRVTLDDDGDGVRLSMSGMDRSAVVQRARRTTSYVVNAGTGSGYYSSSPQPLEDVLEDAIADRDRLATFNLPTTGDQVESIIVWPHGPDSEPLQQIRRLARNYGWDLHVGADGRWTMDTPAGFDDTAVLSVVDGDGGVLVKVRDDVETGDRQFNGVQVESTAADLSAPVIATVWDDEDKTSPTYRPAYGDVPFFYASPLVRTAAQAERAATTILRGLLGRDAELTVEMLPNPAVEAGDPWTVTRAASGLVEAKAVVDVVTHPLTAGGLMQAVCRRRYA